MTGPWPDLKATEMRVIVDRSAGRWNATRIDELRRLLERVEGDLDAEEAICYHGAHALVYEHDGQLQDAIRHRRVEIAKIERLHEITAREGPAFALVNYEQPELELRRRILVELERDAAERN